MLSVSCRSTEKHEKQKVNPSIFAETIPVSILHALYKNKHTYHTPNLVEAVLVSFYPKHEQMISTKLNAGGRVYSTALVDLSIA